MIEAYRGNRPRTGRFLRFQVSLENALTGIVDKAGEQWIDSKIRTHNRYRSFQDPGRISEAIRLISDISLWENVGRRMGSAPKEVTEDLRRIIDRRNQIAHEADMVLSPFEERWPMDRMMVSNAVDMVEKIAEAIYDAVVSNP